MNRILIISALAFLISCIGLSKFKLTPEAQLLMDKIDSMTHLEQIQLMKNTPYQTPAFIFDSGKSGSNIIIIGGTHGNEPAGYESSLRLVDMFQKKPPKTGKIILVPLANRQSVIRYNRRIPVPDGVDIERGNLNRCYPGKKDGLPMEQMALEIETLARKFEVDVFIDMHEARYLHLNTPDESYREQGLGQTIIYSPNEPSSWLIMNMIDQINTTIENPDHQFSSVERPILNSAAWWAGKELGIASFTFETSRLLDMQFRIDCHLKLVKIVLEEEGVW